MVQGLLRIMAKTTKMTLKWTRRTGTNYDEIKSGDFFIHRSLDKFTAYRVNPFERFGVFDTAKLAVEYIEGLAE